ncbi:hypothetical protein [Priestia megaterium]|nr:hypothetical protein [Priestia megaterium]
MKTVEHEDWMKMIKELNAGQPSLMDLINRQIDSYEQEKKDKGGK